MRICQGIHELYALGLEHICIEHLGEHSGSAGDAIDWGLKAPWFEARHPKSHCSVSLSMTLYSLLSTVEPVLGGHSKTDKTKILMTNGSLIKVESIAECSPWSILQYF